MKRSMRRGILGQSLRITKGNKTWKFMLLLAVFALAITFGFITTRAQAEINPGSSTSGSAYFTPGSNLGAFLMSTARYFLADTKAIALRLSVWFATDTPSPSSMLFLGGGFLLFGALLRRRPSTL
jgi:hypothetical protein